MTTKAEKDEPGYIKLPVAVVVPLFGFVASLAGAGGSYLSKTDNDQLNSAIENIHHLESSCEESGDIARAATRLATENRVSINANWVYIRERTEGRYTADQAAQYAREQDAKDAHQDRRLDGVERDVDKIKVQ